MTDLVHLIYASRPFGFDDGTLNSILIGARRNNVRDDITGALICRADIYLQLIEGPEAAIEAAFSRIARDNRHDEVRRCVKAPIAERLFPAWAMRDDPARSWMWTMAEIDDGALTRATPEDFIAVFARLAAEPD